MLGIHPAQKVGAFEIEEGNFRVHRTRLRKPCLLLWREGMRDAGGNRASHFALYGEDIAQLQVVGVCPQMFIRRGLDELNRDAHPVTGPHHRALDQSVNAQFARDLGSRLVRACISHGRGVRDHSERTNLSQVGDEFVSYAVRKELLIGIGGKACEREHYDRLDWMRAKRVPRNHCGNNKNDARTNPDEPPREWTSMILLLLIRSRLC